jgi:predicted DNA-binding ribbon-helix-helix protein
MINDPSSIRKHSVLVAGHETSVSTENAFWDGLCSIARERNLSINDLVAEIDSGRRGNLSSAIRLFVLQHSKN